MLTPEEYAKLRQAGPSPYSPAHVTPSRHPEGWEPGVKLDGTHGTITSRPSPHSAPDWHELLSAWGFDPALYEVLEPVQVRTWDAYARSDDGTLQTKQLWYHRANIRARSIGPRADMDALARTIRRYKPRRGTPPGGDHALVVCLSDWQIGKGEGGGTPETVDRLLAMITAVERRITELRLLGRSVGALYVFGLGDVVEGCSGFYPMQEFSTDLDRREQVAIARRIILRAITTWAPLVTRVVVAAVGGNHGENRRDGKAFTTFGDNDDVAVFEQVAEICAASPALQHVSFVIPRDELAITLDVAGTVCALAHGHQARASGQNAQAKLRRWWEGQTFGRQSAGDASVLFTGHYHHLSVVEHGSRTHIQCPSIDGGSQWLTARTGDASPPGQLTVLVGGGLGRGRGWDDIAVV